MGINTSRLKGRKLIIQSLPKNVQTKSDKVTQPSCFLSSDVEYVGKIHAFHFIKKNLFQSNFSSPIEERLIQSGYKVLDVGCGSGTWLLDMSTNYEKTHFWGLDFQSIYPQEIKPPNLNFIQADILDGLPFPDNEFDFVHQDTMVSSLKKDKWEFVISELVRVTKPGGYIEITETIQTFIGFGPIMQKIFNNYNSFHLKQDLDFKVMHKLDSILESHPNITKVYRDEKEMIVGPNGGKVGLACQENFIALVSTEMTTQILSSEIGISKEEFINMIGNDLTDELKETRPKFTNFRLWTQKI